MSLECVLGCHDLEVSCTQSFNQSLQVPEEVCSSLMAEIAIFLQMQLCGCKEKVEGICGPAFVLRDDGKVEVGNGGSRDAEPGELRVRIEVGGWGSREVGLEYVNHSGNDLNSFVVVFKMEGFDVVDGVDKDEGEPVSKVGGCAEKNVMFV